MSRAARLARFEAKRFDKHIARHLRDVHTVFIGSGYSYEMAMVDYVHEFFSEEFWGYHFELRFTFNGRDYAFMGYNDKGDIMDTTSNEVLALYGRVNALKSMLKDRTFGSMQKWGAACQNAVGGNIRSMTLKGRLFAAGQCYEDLILGAKAAREASGVEVSDLSGDDDEV
jgi:hypothetical protein